MQILAETEYQDLYRVADGVLLVVNKFKPIDYSEKTDRCFYIYDAKTRRYNKGCQDYLKVLKEDYYNKYADVTVPKGTVMYGSTPVEPITNELEFDYQIKTTGDSFSGNAQRMKDLIEDIQYRIKYGEVKHE